MIPDGMTTAADMAIYNNPYLPKVVIPASLAKVGNYFLGQCSKLEEVIVGNPLDLRLCESSFSAHLTFSASSRRGTPRPHAR